LQLSALDADASFGIARFQNSVGFGPRFFLGKTRGTSINDFTVIQDTDFFGEIFFQGSDGSKFITGAAISGKVDGAPGSDDMPGRLVFRTTSDGASFPTDRWRIRPTGHFDAEVDNTYDIGTASQRPRSGLFGTDLTAGSNVTANIVIGTWGGVLGGLNVVPAIVGAFAQSNIAMLTSSSAYDKANAANILALSSFTRANLSRRLLTTDQRYYVRTDGSDSNDGLTDSSGGAFLTIQKALDVVANTIDLAGATRVTINIGAGTYIESPVAHPAIGGPGFNSSNNSVNIQGANTANANATIIQPTSGNYAFEFRGAVGYNVKGIKFKANNADCISVGGRSDINFYKVHLVGDNSDNSLFYVTERSSVTMRDTFTLEGSDAIALNVNGDANFYNFFGATLIGTPNFTYAFASLSGPVSYVAFANFTGSATGKRYVISNLASVYPNGDTAFTHFPGDVAGFIDASSTYGSFIPANNAWIAANAAFDKANIANLNPVGNTMANGYYTTRATRHLLNFIPGTNVQVNVNDDSSGDRINVTISATGSGGISAVIQDATPTLGGDLDINSFKIKGNGKINVASFGNNLATREAVAQIFSANAETFPNGWGNTLKLRADRFPALWFSTGAFSNDEPSGLIYAFEGYTANIFWMEHVTGTFATEKQLKWDFNNQFYFPESSSWQLGTGTKPWKAIYLLGAYGIAFDNDTFVWKANTGNVIISDGNNNRGNIVVSNVFAGNTVSGVDLRATNNVYAPLAIEAGAAIVSGLNVVPAIIAAFATANSTNTLGVANTYSNDYSFIQSTRGSINFRPLTTDLKIQVVDDSTRGMANVTFDAPGIGLAYAKANAANILANQVSAVAQTYSNGYTFPQSTRGTINFNPLTTDLKIKVVDDASLGMANVTFDAPGIGLAYAQSNIAMLTVSSAYDRDNVVSGVANTANDRANLAQMASNAAYNFANTINVKLESGFTTLGTIAVRDQIYGNLTGNIVNIISLGVGTNTGYYRVNTGNVHYYTTPTFEGWQLWSNSALAYNAWVMNVKTAQDGGNFMRILDDGLTVFNVSQDASTGRYTVDSRGNVTANILVGSWGAIIGGTNALPYMIAAFDVANTHNGAIAAANAIAVAAFGVANVHNGAMAQMNTAIFGVANTANDRANLAQMASNAAYNFANTINVKLESGFTTLGTIAIRDQIYGNVTGNIHNIISLGVGSNTGYLRVNTGNVHFFGTPAIEVWQLWSNASPINAYNAAVINVKTAQDGGNFFRILDDGASVFNVSQDATTGRYTVDTPGNVTSNILVGSWGVIASSLNIVPALIAGYGVANTANDRANLAQMASNAAFGVANTALQNVGGVTTTGDFKVQTTMFGNVTGNIVNILSQGVGTNGGYLRVNTGNIHFFGTPAIEVWQLWSNASPINAYNAAVINVKTAQDGGNFFRILDDGASVFNVSQDASTARYTVDTPGNVTSNILVGSWGAIIGQKNALPYMIAAFDVANTHNGAMSQMNTAIFGQANTSNLMAVGNTIASNSYFTVRGNRTRLNFVEGTNVTIKVDDDSSGDRINVTITSTASGPGGSGMNLTAGNTQAGVYTTRSSAYANINFINAENDTLKFNVDSDATSFRINVQPILTPVYVSDSPPATLRANTLWFESNTGSMFLYYADSNSSQFIEVGGFGPGYAHEEVLTFAISDEFSQVVTGTNRFTYHFMKKFYLLEVFASLSQNSSAGNTFVEVNQNGTSILSPNLNIYTANAHTINFGSPTMTSTTITWNKGDKLNVNVSAAGTGATGLKVHFRGYWDVI
jgi:hypothetical protein